MQHHSQRESISNPCYCYVRREELDVAAALQTNALQTWLLTPGLGACLAKWDVLLARHSFHAAIKDVWCVYRLRLGR